MNVAYTPRTVKAENQTDKDWGSEARRLLKEEMEARGWGYRELAENLARMNISIDAASVNRRINRGNFSAGFMLMCLELMGMRFEVLPEAPGIRKREKNKKPIDDLESVIGNWGKKSC